MITSNSLGILVFVIAQFILLLLWMALSFAPGFALYDGTPGHAHSVSHIGWWLMMEALVVFSGAFTYKYRITSSNLSSNAKFEYSVAAMRNYLVYFHLIDKLK